MTALRPDDPHGTRRVATLFMALYGAALVVLVAFAAVDLTTRIAH